MDILALPKLIKSKPELREYYTYTLVKLILVIYLLMKMVTHYHQKTQMRYTSKVMVGGIEKLEVIVLVLTLI